MSGNIKPKKPPENGAADDLNFTNAPNMLTLLRMGMAPVVVALLFLRTETGDWIAMVAFALASITDWLDGWLARRRNIVTVYGKLMDPLADKFLVISALVMLQELGRIHPVVVILLICREMAITGLRALASAEGVILSASRSAKWKTGTQMVAIPFLMVPDNALGLPAKTIGLVLLYVSLGISLWSAQDYIFEFFRNLREARKAKAAERRTAREARLSSRRTRMAAKARKLQDHERDTPGPKS